MSYFNYVLHNVDKKEIVVNGEFARTAKKQLGYFQVTPQYPMISGSLPPRNGAS
jgi:hypothetical protein